MTIDIMVKMKLSLVDLTRFADLKPAEISGGMKKRAALARALALDRNCFSATNDGRPRPDARDRVR
jgi:ABC-type transporter Mla maintaining outer membrane lipid asymmetry ATPase subunit MlaF